MLKKVILLSFFLFYFLSLSIGQSSVLGILNDADTKQGLAGVVVTVKGTAIGTTSDAKGVFQLDNLPQGNITIVFDLADYESTQKDIVVTDFPLIDLGIIKLINNTGIDLTTQEEIIPVITVTDAELDDNGGGNDNISGLLTASRDVFMSAAAFVFGPARFRIRGYDSENTLLYLNGVPVNELENGRTSWNQWGGLNDVLRNRSINIGLGATDYSFGGVGGASHIDTRASRQRAQTRISYSSSNRSYRHRVMATHNTGMTEKGWALSLSGSRRWAQEGYIEGTFYDAWAYFLSVDKVINKSHALNLTAFGAPLRRGRSAASTQEIYDLAGSNYYNPNWGYQNGQKRNARSSHSHQPMFILRHDWTLGNNALLTTAASYQFGANGGTALDWFDAPDPRPDYYRNLPSNFTNESQEVADGVANTLSTSEEARQINWAQLYEINYGNLVTIEDANGTGESVTGYQSQYIIEDRRYDSKEFNFNTNYQNVINDKLTVHAGLSYQIYKGENYKVVEDLLGGEFYIDVDKFALRDSIGNSDARQNDLNNPNRILAEGDTWGYNYDANIHKPEAWLQGLWSSRKVDFFAAVNVSNTSFWRTGNYRHGRFPNNSFGNSERQSFLNYGVKGGLTFKVDGRNYVFANGSYMTRAPYFRNAYVSPRTRDQLVPNLTSETIYSGEAGYLLRSPNLKARASVYYTEHKDRIKLLRFYNDFERAFGNYILSGVNEQRLGTELAIEATVVAGLKVSAVAAIGQYIYTSRPQATIVQDNTDAFEVDGNSSFTIYSDNYYIPGMPQAAYTAGLNYRSKKFWFANLNFNYFDNIYMDFSPERRRADAVFGIEDDNLFNEIIEQEKVDPAFTLDFFAGKSFKFGSTFLYLTVGVSNVLNNQNFITGGFEQLRFDTQNRDVNRFPNRYYYSYGRNYFVNASIRL